MIKNRLDMPDSRNIFLKITFLSFFQMLILMIIWILSRYIEASSLLAVFHALWINILAAGLGAIPIFLFAKYDAHVFMAVVFASSAIRFILSLILFVLAIKFFQVQKYVFTFWMLSFYFIAIFLETFLAVRINSQLKWKKNIYDDAVNQIDIS